MTTEFTEPTSLVPPAGQAPRLSEEQLHHVFLAACEFMAAAIAQRPERLTDNSLAGADAVTVMGAFVTLKRSGRLRACCGTLGRPMRLFNALREAALRTATDDIRLPTISPMELSHLDVEVSLLHSFVPISLPAAARADAVAVGRHGLQIQRGPAAGLLLPSVGREHGFTAEEFLRQVCIKAGLPTSAWQEEDASIQTFEAVTVTGPFATESLVDVVASRPLLSREELQRLTVHSAANLAALRTGRHSQLLSGRLLGRHGQRPSCVAADCRRVGCCAFLPTFPPSRHAIAVNTVRSDGSRRQRAASRSDSASVRAS